MQQSGHTRVLACDALSRLTDGELGEANEPARTEVPSTENRHRERGMPNGRGFVECGALSRLTDGAVVPEILSTVKRVRRPPLNYRVLKIEMEACRLATASFTDQERSETSVRMRRPPLIHLF